MTRATGVMTLTQVAQDFWISGAKTHGYFILSRKRFRKNPPGVALNSEIIKTLCSVGGQGRPWWPWGRKAAWPQTKTWCTKGCVIPTFLKAPWKAGMPRPRASPTPRDCCSIGASGSSPGSRTPLGTGIRKGGRHFSPGGRAKSQRVNLGKTVPAPTPPEGVKGLKGWGNNDLAPRGAALSQRGLLTIGN